MANPGSEECSASSESVLSLAGIRAHVHRNRCSECPESLLTFVGIGARLGSESVLRFDRNTQQVKTVHEIAPVFLKNEDRIEALFFLYFVALLLQALVEREIRNAMKRKGIEELPIYPEERLCKRPTSEQILRLFGWAERHVLFDEHEVIQVFAPELSEIQQQVLKLLGVPADAYKAVS